MHISPCASVGEIYDEEEAKCGFCGHNAKSGVFVSAETEKEKEIFATKCDPHNFFVGNCCVRGLTPTQILERIENLPDLPAVEHFHEFGSADSIEIDDAQLVDLSEGDAVKLYCRAHAEVADMNPVAPIMGNRPNQLIVNFKHKSAVELPDYLDAYKVQCVVCGAEFIAEWRGRRAKRLSQKEASS